MPGKNMHKGMQCLAVLLVVGMFAAAGWLDEKALIFPEIAALACGAWVMHRPPWRFTALTVWASPTLAAFSGVALLRFFPAAPLFLICAAFVAVLLQLRVTRSAVIPSLSAAILPIITRVESLWYPCSVCVLTGLIALIHLVKAGTVPREEHRLAQQGKRPQPVTLEEELRQGGKLTAGVFLIALIALRSHLLFMVAPPLIVTFVELSKPESVLRRRVWRVLALLTLAAFAGVAELHLIHFVLHWPLSLSAAATVVTVFFLYHAFSLPFPPAAAIALLPTIIPADTLWYYPWQVLLGSAAFAALGLLFFRADEVIALPQGP